MVERLGSRLAGSVLLWDLLATLLCLRLAANLRLWLPLGKNIYLDQVQLPWALYLVAALIWGVIFLILTPQRALFGNSLVEAVGRLSGAVALASLTFAGLLYVTYRDISRLQFVYFVGLDLALLLAMHLAIRAYSRLHSHQGWQRRVLLAGGGIIGEQLAREFARRPWAGVEIVGYTSDEPPIEDAGPLLGPLAATPEIVVGHQIDEVIFTAPPQRQDQIIQLSLLLQQQPVMLHMAPSVLDLAFARTPVQTLGGIPLISLRESALTDSQWILKRLFDIVASTIALILCSPLMVAVALAIRWETPGPVFFRQERIGQHGRRFRMLKFRSMYDQADQHWRSVAQRHEQGYLIHKRDDDPRITPLGRKLRRTSMDELPQLINVLRGEMSLVGPRPEMPDITVEYAPWQWQRFRVPAGMTGWWQVNGRSSKPMHLHTEDDLYYIQNYSFWLDLKILWMTIWVVLKGQGAF